MGQDRPVATERSGPDIDDRENQDTGGVRSIASGLLFVVVAVVVQLVRQPGVPTWYTVWAEDATIYTNDALTHPAVETLLRDYAGYTQFTSRLLALGTRVVPVEGIAAYLAVTAAFVTALLALVVVRSARWWVRSPALRWSLGVMVVVAPVTFSELNATLSNLGWPYVVAGFWAIFSREEGRFDTPVRCLTVLLGTLSTLVDVVLLPWAVVVAVRRRRRSDLLVLGSMVAGLAVEFLAAQAADPERSDASRSAGRLVEMLGLRIFGSLVAGERWIAHLSPVERSRWGWSRSPRSWSSSCWPALHGSMVIGGCSSAAPPSPRSAPTPSRPGTEAPRCRPLRARRDGAGWSRYAYPPVLLIFSALVVMVDSSDRRWLKVVLLAQTTLVIATSLTLAGPRSAGPSWWVEVRDARPACRADPALTSAQLQISPMPTWSVHIDCDRLR